MIFELRTLGLFMLFCWLFFSGRAQIPSGNWGSPVTHPIQLSGTFAELRPNHFHGGIDIKSSRGISGDSVISVQDGYLSRILIHPNGYGKAVYVTHPSGYTTVYAHLDRFDKSIENLMWVMQRTQMSYYLDYSLDSTVFPVTKGQLLGFLGNTGRSFGPHLHFELKDSKSNIQINPLSMGYVVKDGQPPILKNLYVHYFDDLRREVKSQSLKLNKLPDSWYSPADTIEVHAGLVALSLQANDVIDGLPHQNGVYRLELFVDDKLTYLAQFDSFPKAYSRYLNAHSHYKTIQVNNRYIHRLHRLPGNKMTWYNHLENNGNIELKVGEFKHIKVAAYDFNQNQSLLKVVLKAVDTPLPVFTEPDHSFYFMPDIPNAIKEESLRLEIPVGTFFEPTYFSFDSKKTNRKHVFSSVFSFTGPSYPMVESVNLSIKPDTINGLNISKLCIAETSQPYFVNMGGNWDGNWMHTAIRQWGSYAIVLDTVPPSISPIQFTAKASKKKTFTFKINDNLGVGGLANPISIKAFVQDKWVRGEMISGDQKLILYLDDIRGSDLRLDIYAEDALGNQTHQSYTFSR